jgi:hypothetical protein
VSSRVAEALDALGIAGLRDRPTHLLFYGRRKRAAIAGAAAMRPHCWSSTSRPRGSTRTGRSSCLTEDAPTGRRLTRT